MALKIVTILIVTFVTLNNEANTTEVEMKQTITRHWPQDTAFDGSVIPAKDDTFMQDTGWQSVAEMQRELLKRFKHRGAVKIPGGARYQETFFQQSVTLAVSDYDDDALLDARDMREEIEAARNK